MTQGRGVAGLLQLRGLYPSAVTAANASAVSRFPAARFMAAASAASTEPAASAKGQGKGGKEAGAQSAVNSDTKVKVAVILERYPITQPPLSDFEKEYGVFSYQVSQEKSAVSFEEYLDMRREQEKGGKKKQKQQKNKKQKKQEEAKAQPAEPQDSDAPIASTDA